MSNSQLRAAERHILRFRVVFDDGVSYSSAYVENVSRTGLYLETSHPLTPGTVICLEPIESSTDALFEVKARVVRSEMLDPHSVKPSEQDGAFGIAVTFLDLNEEAQRAVQHMIDRLDADERARPRQDDPFRDLLAPEPRVGG